MCGGEGFQGVCAGLRSIMFVYARACQSSGVEVVVVVVVYTRARVRHVHTKTRIHVCTDTARTHASTQCLGDGVVGLLWGTVLDQRPSF